MVSLSNHKYDLCKSLKCQYKKLRDFALTFDGNSFIDVFVGKNGTGKSNLFEALIVNYRIIFEINANEAELV